jgi:hypothetical protein
MQVLPPFHPSENGITPMPPGAGDDGGIPGSVASVPFFHLRSSYPVVIVARVEGLRERKRKRKVVPVRSKVSRSEMGVRSKRSV